jgi:acyl-coenzyme A thioesterase PaaI-like protein
MAAHPGAATSLTFAQVSAISTSAISNGAIPDSGLARFEAEVNPEWTIAGKPNGGYLLAMMGRAASSVSRHPHVIAASACYLSSPEPGPVWIEADVLRAGRSASQVRARLSQGDRTCVEALLTTSELDADAKPHWSSETPSVSQVRYEDCARLVPRMPNGAPVAIMDQVEIRIEPGYDGFTRGRPTGRGELRGWLSLPGGEAFTPASLLYAIDSYPPATFDVEPSGWVPTLELTGYVRALPAPGPVRVLQRAQLIDANRVDEICYIWDQTGRLVAQGTQLAAIRFA